MPNHLADESSPYLLQHAENPVEWYPWGAAALERARTGYWTIASTDIPALLGKFR